LTRGELPAPASPAPPRRQVRWAQLASRYAMLCFFAALVVVLLVVSPTFRDPANLLNILQQNAIIGIVACGMLLMIVVGGFDLSVGAVASMAGFVVATLVSGPGTPTGIVVALVAAALAGLVTGIGVGVFRVHPLIMTLGMSLVVLGLANVWQLQMVQTN